MEELELEELEPKEWLLEWLEELADLLLLFLLLWVLNKCGLDLLLVVLLVLLE